MIKYNIHIFLLATKQRFFCEYTNDIFLSHGVRVFNMVVINTDHYCVTLTDYPFIFMWIITYCALNHIVLDYVMM